MKWRVNNLLATLPARTRLALLLLLEALIFLLDLDTGASISFAPFLSAPTALSAWYLDRRATALFVVLSSIARTYDYHMVRARHEAWYMVLYELLQSALFYSIVAALVLRLRGAADRLALHASHVRNSARHERHRRLLESGIRRAVPGDIGAIMRLTSQGAQRGGFDKEVANDARLGALSDSFQYGIAEGLTLRDVWTGGQATVPVEFWVARVNGHIAGFLMIMGLNEQKGNERELHAVVVDDAYRGLGIGAALTDFFCSHYTQRRLFAACKPGTQMMGMLLRRGFKLFAASSGEFHVIVRE